MNRDKTRVFPAFSAVLDHSAARYPPENCSHNVPIPGDLTVLPRGHVARLLGFPVQPWGRAPPTIPEYTPYKARHSEITRQPTPPENVMVKAQRIEIQRQNTPDDPSPGEKGYPGWQHGPVPGRTGPGVDGRRLMAGHKTDVEGFVVLPPISFEVIWSPSHEVLVNALREYHRGRVEGLRTTVALRARQRWNRKRRSP